MRITTIGDAPVGRNKNGVLARKLYSRPDGEAVHIRIEPGRTLPTHTTPVDVFMYVLEGNGEVEVGEEREKVEQGMLVESPMNIPHALYNTGEGPFRVLVIKMPKP